MTRLMACGAVLALAGAAMAQDRPPPPREDAPPALRGPRVKEDRVPGTEGSFGEGRPEGRGGQRGLPPGAFMAAIAKLHGDDVPEELRLTDKQEAKLKALREEMGPAMREAGAARRQRDGQPPSDDMKAERRKMAERAQEVQTKAFAILTPEQKDYVKGEMEKARKEADGRQSEQRVQRKMKERGANQPPQGQPPAPPPPPGEMRPDQPEQGARWQRDGAGPQGPRGGPEGGPPVPRERLRHIAELLGQLSPEEREQFLNRIERSLEERVGGGPDGDAPRPRRAGPDGAPPADGQPPRQRRPRPDQPPEEGQRPTRNPPG